MPPSPVTPQGLRTFTPLPSSRFLTGVPITPTWMGPGGVTVPPSHLPGWVLHNPFPVSTSLPHRAQATWSPPAGPRMACHLTLELGCLLSPRPGDLGLSSPPPDIPDSPPAGWVFPCTTSQHPPHLGPTQSCGGLLCGWTSPKTEHVSVCSDPAGEQNASLDPIASSITYPTFPSRPGFSPLDSITEQKCI